MKYGRVNATFKEEGTFSTLSLDIHAVGYFSIEDWLKLLEERKDSMVARGQDWYLSYFVVMDAQATPCGSAVHNHEEKPRLPHG